MCRWLAYSGPALGLEALLFQPNHSLIDQSLHARYLARTTNADGFGVAWFGGADGPGLYRDVRPAWNDENLREVARHVRAPLFLAHVRAATGTAVQRANCHPFRHGRWVFQHNGIIPLYREVVRELRQEVAPELYPDIAGTTDSELIFYLALTYGLEEDAPAALARAVGRVERACESAGADEPVLFSAAAADGERIVAVRYATGGVPRTVFVSRHRKALTDLHGDYMRLPEGAVLVVSEPLDTLTDRWEEIPPSTLLVAERGKIETHPFAPL